MGKKHGHKKHAPKPSIHKDLFARVSLSASSFAPSLSGVQPSIPPFLELLDNGDLPAPTTPNLALLDAVVASVPANAHCRTHSNSTVASQPQDITQDKTQNYFQVLPPSPPNSPPTIKASPAFLNPIPSQQSPHPVLGSPLLSPAHISVPHPSPNPKPVSNDNLPISELLNEVQTLKSRLKLLELGPEERDRWNEIEVCGVAYQDILDEFYYCQPDEQRVHTEQASLMTQGSGSKLLEVSQERPGRLRGASYYSEVEEQSRTLNAAEENFPHHEEQWGAHDAIASNNGMDRPVNKIRSYSQVEAQSRTLNEKFEEQDSSILGRPHSSQSHRQEKERDLLPQESEKIQPHEDPEHYTVSPQQRFDKNAIPESKGDIRTWTLIPPGYAPESEQEKEAEISHQSHSPTLSPPSQSLTSSSTMPAPSSPDASLPPSPITPSEAPLPTSTGCHYTFSAGGVSPITIIYPSSSLPHSMRALLEERTVIQKALAGWNRGESDRYGVRPSKRAYAAIIYPDPKTPLPRKKLQISLSFTPIIGGAEGERTEPDRIVTDIDIFLWAKNGSFRNGPLDWYKVGREGVHTRHDGVVEVGVLGRALGCEVFGEEEDDE